MEQEQTRVEQLFIKYYDRTATEQEQRELAGLLAGTGNEHLHHALQTASQTLPQEALIDPAKAASMMEAILGAGTLPDTALTPVRRIKWIRYAAAVILLLAGAGIFYYQNQPSPATTTARQSLQQPDVPPGGQKALLTLSDGSTIVLDTAANGSLASQGNTTVVKSGDGSLAYQKGKGSADAGLYNTVSTPNGGQYQVTLPDGTRVWLNAASSIRFPTAFEKQRRVTITGEAYLEVMNDKSKPFLAVINGTEVHVLGTSFNINGYDDAGAVRTTLVTGIVNVNGNLLKPGQASQNGRISIANLQQDLAWKNGFFNFEDKTLPEVMHQLARWYNIEVVLPEKIPVVEFGGEMGRNLTLNQVLKSLEGVGVHFRKEAQGKRLIVLP